MLTAQFWILTLCLPRYETSSAFICYMTIYYILRVSVLDRCPSVVCPRQLQFKCPVVACRRCKGKDECWKEEIQRSSLGDVALEVGLVFEIVVAFSSWVDLDREFVLTVLGFSAQYHDLSVFIHDFLMRLKGLSCSFPYTFWTFPIYLIFLLQS